MIKGLALALLLLASPVGAVEPEEILADPALETRARALSKGLRCLVCRNESIDDSDATLARDLRLLVRERLVAGDTNAQALDFIVARYGEYVLLTPTGTGSNLILWAAGPAMLLAGGGIALVYMRRRAPGQTGDRPDPLSDDEAARLAALLKD